jgi:hypothetical protein
MGLFSAAIGRKRDQKLVILAKSAEPIRRNHPHDAKNEIGLKILCILLNNLGYFS